MNIFDSPLFTWVVLPLLIFLARVLDVSIGTLRIVYIARGQKIIAPVLGFFESMIWLLAIGQIIKHLDNAVCYIAYASGFASGNFVGMLIERKLALGMQVVRIITRINTGELLHELRRAGFGVTIVDAQGSTGPVKVIFTLIKRRDLPRVITLINQHNPRAFYTVEDVQLAQDELAPELATSRRRFYQYLFRMDRKRK